MYPVAAVYGSVWRTRSAVRRLLIMMLLVPLALALTAAALMTLLLRRGRPADAATWLALVLSGLVIVTSAAMAVVLRGVDRPTVYELSDVLQAPTDAPATVLALVGQPAPDAAFVNLASGERVRLSELRGRVVLLNLWATWCPPCLREMPDLNRLDQDYGPLGLTVVALSDEPLQTIQSFVQARTFEFLVAQAPIGSLDSAYEAARRTLPTTFVIDREGVVQAVESGARDYAHFAEIVQPLLQPGLASR